MSSSPDYGFRPGAGDNWGEWEPQDDAREPPPHMEAEDALGVPGVIGPTVVEALAHKVSRDAEDLSPLAEPLLNVVQAVSCGSSITEAVNRVRSHLDRACVISLIFDTSRELDSSAFTAWGELGEPVLESDRALVALLTQNAEIPAKLALRELYAQMRYANKPADRIKLDLLQLLAALAPDELKVVFITADQARGREFDLVDTPAEKSRGWYVARTKEQAIYALSPEFLYSGLTLETLTHEILRAVLLHCLAEAGARQEDLTARELLAGLERLRVAAETVLATRELEHLRVAVKDVPELVTWGLTNAEFQREVLANVAARSEGSPAEEGLRALLKMLMALLLHEWARARLDAHVAGLTHLVSSVSGLYETVARAPSRITEVVRQR